MKNKFEDLISSMKVSDLLATTKLNELIHKKEDPIEEKKHTVVFVLAIIGTIAAIAAIAYFVYRCVTPNYLDDFDDDFDDEFEEDFGLDETSEEKTETTESKKDKEDKKEEIAEFKISKKEFLHKLRYFKNKYQEIKEMNEIYIHDQFLISDFAAMKPGYKAVAL